LSQFTDWRTIQRARVSINKTELYNPSSGKFTATGNMTATREEHTVVLLADCNGSTFGIVLPLENNGHGSSGTTTRKYHSRGRKADISEVIHSLRSKTPCPSYDPSLASELHHTGL
jgi:hypothetical protein